MKGKYLYSFLVAGLLLNVPLIAEAKLAANGMSMQGPGLITSKITPVATQGIVRVEGGQLVIQTAPIAQ
jgi:hypothetical protein